MNYAALSAPREANTQRVAFTAASAVSGPINNNEVVLTVTAACFMIAGQAPVAVAQTCAYLAPNIPYLIGGLKEGDRIALILGSVGNADGYITPRP